MAVLFDTLKFVETLKNAGFAEEQAKAVSMAVRDTHDSAELATKSDIRELEQRLDLRLLGMDERFNAKLETIMLQMTVRLGGLIAGGIAVLIALNQFS